MWEGGFLGKVAVAVAGSIVEPPRRAASFRWVFLALRLYRPIRLHGVAIMLWLFFVQLMYAGD